jgi:cation transport ATPase
MIITSDIEGRLRIRDGQLKGALAAEALRDAVAVLPGVNESKVNMKAGSLTVLYSHSTDVRETILNRIEQYIPASGRENRSPTSTVRLRRPDWPLRKASRRKLITRSMIATLSLSLFSLVLGREKVHVIAGMLFVGVLGFHLADKRRVLFA